MNNYTKKGEITFHTLRDNATATVIFEGQEEVNFFRRFYGKTFPEIDFVSMEGGVTSYLDKFAYDAIVNNKKVFALVDNDEEGHKYETRFNKLNIKVLTIDQVLNMDVSTFEDAYVELELMPK
jgi:hypothetical protein